MARESSQIVEENGKLYRKTPVDYTAEAQRRLWTKRNYITVSTRIPKGKYSELRRYCKAHGLTMYALLGKLVHKTLEADRTPNQNAQEE